MTGQGALSSKNPTGVKEELLWHVLLEVQNSIGGILTVSLQQHPSVRVYRNGLLELRTQESRSKDPSWLCQDKMTVLLYCIIDVFCSIAQL